MEVGFIGLGAMGSHMAANLVKAGHVVHVWNRGRAAVDRLVALGAKACAIPRDAMRGDVVVSMLSGDVAARAVFIDGKVLDAENASKTVHVDMSTISVAFAKELTALHAKKQVAYVAAPVFGRPQAAKAGTLNIVVAGPDEAVERALPLLAHLGQVFRLGEKPQHASVVKIAGTLMIGCALEAMAESAALVESHGVRASDFFNIVNNTMFAAPVYQSYGAIIAERRDVSVPAGLALAERDINLALAAGADENVSLPFASQLRDNLLDARAHSDADRDWSFALANVARRRGGLT
jgi:3-hydroxyisobutyrate dehydrogenase-like beta-hydroxyacid dehydrogenase